MNTVIFPRRKAPRHSRLTVMLMRTLRPRLWPDQTADKARDQARLLPDAPRDPHYLTLTREALLARCAALERHLADVRSERAITGEQFVADHFEPYLVARSRTGNHRIQVLRQNFGELLRLPLAEITTTQVLQWRAQALANGLSPATVNRKVDVLRGMLSCAVRWNLLARDPSRGVGRPEVPEERRPRLSRDERTRLFGVLLTAAWPSSEAR